MLYCDVCARTVEPGEAIKQQGQIRHRCGSQLRRVTGYTKDVDVPAPLDLDVATTEAQALMKAQRDEVEATTVEGWVEARERYERLLKKMNDRK